MIRAVAVVSVLVALLATGCGSKPKPVTKAQYEVKVQTLGADLVRAGSAIGRHLDIATFNGDIANFQDHLRAASKDLHGLEPPPNARALNKRLADSFHDLADDLEPVKDARRKSIIEAGKAFNVARRSSAARGGRQAVKELQRKGYDVGQMAAL